MAPNCTQPSSIEEIASALRKGGDSPWKAWRRSHPDADPSKVTARQVIEAWDDSRRAR